jgi:thioesterase domain-containing protein
MNDSEAGSNRFGTVVAVLIAVVTVVGAIVAWRVAVALSNAGSADTLGILAAVEKEDVTTRATITLIGHRTAYATFKRDDSLATKYSELAHANPQRTDFSNLAGAFKSAANYALYWIPARYIDRSNELDRQRDLGEQIAQDSINKDMEPQPHFAAADSNRQKAQWLLVNLILLGMTLLFLTMADAIQNLLRYLLLLGGLGLLGISTVAVLLIEFFGPPVF